MFYHCSGMALSATISTGNPEWFMKVCIVVIYSIYDFPQHIVELSVWNKVSPITIFRMNLKSYRRFTNFN